MVNVYAAPKPRPFWIRGLALVVACAATYGGTYWDDLTRSEIDTFKNKSFLYGPDPRIPRTSALTPPIDRELMKD
jgi:hypothetical protein